MKIFRAKPLHQHHFHDQKTSLVDGLFVKREHREPGLNHEMFNQDFASLFHSMNYQNGYLFEIVSNDDELMQKLLGNVKTRYAPHPTDETIREFVEEIAQSLIWYGRAYYFAHDDTEQEEIHIAPFSSSGVMRLFGTHIQWVPKRRESHWDRDDEELPREIRILDAAKVLRFDMPRSIKRMLAKQNRILTALDKHQFGETHFYPQATHENPTPTNHFDFQAWKDTQEYALYRATRGTGWNGRKYGSSKRSDFFDCHRLIRFQRNQLLLRDDILNQLGNELSRVGKGYKTGFSVEISGTDELPNITYLNELEERLAREEVGFNEVMDYCYKH
jgi:O6-methylguanine-DNA--protein-cysteine methyltransferase